MKQLKVIAVTSFISQNMCLSPASLLYTPNLWLKKLNGELTSPLLEHSVAGYSIAVQYKLQQHCFSLLIF